MFLDFFNFFWYFFTILRTFYQRTTLQLTNEISRAKYIRSFPFCFLLVWSTMICFLSTVTIKLVYNLFFFSLSYFEFLQYFLRQCFYNINNVSYNSVPLLLLLVCHALRLECSGIGLKQLSLRMKIRRKPASGYQKIPS